MRPKRRRNSHRTKHEERQPGVSVEGKRAKSPIFYADLHAMLLVVDADPCALADLQMRVIHPQSAQQNEAP